MRNYLLLLAIFTTFAMATEKKHKQFSLSTAFIGMSMDYREYDDYDNILDSEKSDFSELLGGDFSFVYTEALESQNYSRLSANLTILSGKTEYVGAYLGSSTGYGSLVSETKNIIFDTDIDYRFIHTIHTNFQLHYGVGIGYRVWRRELSTIQVEDYKWASIRPKLGMEYSKNGWYFGLEVEYQYGLNPTMTILANAENSDVSVNLGSANIFELSIPIHYSVHKKVDLFVAYVYQNQIIEKSNLVPYVVNGETKHVYEPRSEANNNYVKFGAVFKF